MPRIPDNGIELLDTLWDALKALDDEYIKSAHSGDLEFKSDDLYSARSDYWKTFDEFPFRWCGVSPIDVEFFFYKREDQAQFVFVPTATLHLLTCHSTKGAREYFASIDGRAVHPSLRIVPNSQLPESAIVVDIPELLARVYWIFLTKYDLRSENDYEFTTESLLYWISDLRCKVALHLETITESSSPTPLENFENDGRDGSIYESQEFSASEDYLHVRLRNRSFTLNGRQADIIRILYDAFEAGHPEVHKDRIFNELAPSLTYRNFRKLWGETHRDSYSALIIPSGRGFYRLNIS